LAGVTFVVVRAQGVTCEQSTPVASREGRDGPARSPTIIYTLLAKMLERDLDALIKKLLILGAKLVATIGAAVEKLGYYAHGGMRLTFQPRRASNIDRAIEIIIVDIVIELAHL